MIIDNNTLMNFTELTNNNNLMVLEWRNREDVRVWMYNSNIISQKNHYQFIANLKHDQTKQYYLVASKNDYLGVIYFTNIDFINKCSEFGLYGNPDTKGNGKTLMKIICEYGFNILGMHKIVAEVFEDNQRAIKLYINFNFKKIGFKVENSKKIIQMELTNDNR